MPRRDDDDRGRPSWRDIDKKRDASVHIDKGDPYAKHKRRGGQKAGPSSGYKAALDRFFEGGELPEKFKGLAQGKAKDLPKGAGAERQAVLRELRDAVGRSEVERATKKILELDGELPSDPDVLIAVLQHSDEEIVQDAIALLRAVVAERRLPRKELLKQRLRQVESLAEEPATTEAAAELRRTLG